MGLEKTFVIHVINKELLAPVYKEVLQINEKGSNLLENGTKA